MECLGKVIREGSFFNCFCGVDRECPDFFPFQQISDCPDFLSLLDRSGDFFIVAYFFVLILSALFFIGQRIIKVFFQCVE